MGDRALVGLFLLRQSLSNVFLHGGLFEHVQYQRAANRGAFLPVKAEDTRDHVMHSEWGEVTRETARALNEIRQAGGRVIAVGSRALRLLESAADDSGNLGAFRGETDIFITPGVAITAVDLMLTNFHLPRSTLFMLVAAFSGLDTMKRAYAHAIAQGYRFYSYGDACLLKPADRVT